MKEKSTRVILTLTLTVSSICANAGDNNEKQYFIGLKYGNTIFSDAKQKINHLDMLEGRYPDSPSAIHFDAIPTISINIGKNVYENDAHSIDMYGFYDRGSSEYTSLPERSETTRHLDIFGLGGKYKYSISSNVYSFAGLEVGYYKDTFKESRVIDAAMGCNYGHNCYDTEKSKTYKSGLMSAALVGAGVNLNEDIDVEIGLKYQYLNKNKYDDGFNFKKSNQIYLGLNYHF